MKTSCFITNLCSSNELYGSELTPSNLCSIFVFTLWAVLVLDFVLFVWGLLGPAVVCKKISLDGMVPLQGKA